MSREIKFRGMRYDGTWAYGGLTSALHSPKNKTQIVSCRFYEGKEEHEHYIFINVKPETVGEYTGLKDKKNEEICEDDIVKFHYFFQSFGEDLGVRESEHELIGVVEWGVFGWGIAAIKGEHWQGYTGYNAGEGECNFLDLMAMNESSIHEESFEIIGNIYEHPHLLNPEPAAQVSDTTKMP